MCSWNGCIPVGIKAENEQQAKEQFARDARQRGWETCKAEDVRIED